MGRRHTDRVIYSILFSSLLLPVACGRVHIDGDGQDGAATSQYGVLETGVQQIVQRARPDYVRDAEGVRLWKLTRTFYERRQFGAAWIDGGSPRPQMDALIRAIHAADGEGVDPELYSASLLDRRKEEA